MLRPMSCLGEVDSAPEPNRHGPGKVYKKDWRDVLRPASVSVRMFIQRSSTGVLLIVGQFIAAFAIVPERSLLKALKISSFRKT